jgi:hypothetical protein
MLCGFEEAVKLVNQGSPLIVSGHPDLMARLPRGNWIGGTTPYLMTERGGVDSQDALLVAAMPDDVKLVGIQRYGVGGIHYLPEDTPQNGFTILVIPSASLVHQAYAKAIPTFETTWHKSIAGWVSGTKKEGLGASAKVFFGPISHAIEDEIVAMHIALPDTQTARVKIINLYEPGEGDEITFITEGFTVTHAMINGRMVLFAEYLEQHASISPFPLVADYHGIRLNIDIKNFDVRTGHVVFYAPVFKNVVYRFARSVPDFHARLKKAVEQPHSKIAFECICIRNYERLSMGTLTLGAFEGPVSYGEIAQFLTNMSLVRVEIEDKAPPTVG